MNFCLLVHTFEKYHHLWPGYFKHFRDNWGLQYPESFWGTDIEQPCHKSTIPKPFKPVYSGEGEWSDRLKRLLVQIPYDYVFYMQEDMYPMKNPNLGILCSFMTSMNLLRLQVSPVVQFYSLYGSMSPLLFHHSSKYLVSHQPSFWKKDFLMSCLEKNESPWIHEYEGTKRLANRRSEIDGRIGIYAYDWFKHKSVKGVVVE